MAQVPYQGYPEDRLQDAPLRLDTPGEAFGAGVARATIGAGREISGAGEELWRTAVNLKQLEIEAEVNKAVTDSLVATGEIDNKFRQLEGKDAQDQLPAHIKALTNIRENYRGGITTPYGQKMFDRETMRRLGYDIINAGNYAATQLKQYDKGARVGAQSAITDNLMADPKNRQKQDEFAEDIKRIEDEDSRLSGIQDENVRDKKRKDTLGPRIDQVAKAMANTDPEEASAFLEKMKGYMHGAQYQATLEEVRKRSIGVWGKQEGDRISKLGDAVKDIDLTEQHQLAEDTAKAIAEERKLDPVSELTLREQIISTIDKNSSRRKRELNDRNRALYVDIGQVMNQQIKGGRNPTSFDEANAIDPRFRDKVEEYEKNNPGFGRRLDNWFKANAKQDVPWSVEREANLVKFLGATDEERMQYKPEEMFNNGQITRGMFNRMMEDQAGISRKAKIGYLIDPILVRNHSALDDATAFPSHTDLRANERYKWLRGAATLRMEQHLADKKAPMNHKEEEEMMQSLLEEVTTGKYDWYNPSGWFGGAPQDRRFTLEGQPPVVINSQAERDALPAGRYYIYNGKLSGPKR